MVTAPKIRCVVVVAGSENDGMSARYQPRFRPSDLVPWADPHIRSLIEQLQDEIREEAATAGEPAAETTPRAEEPTLEELTLDWGFDDRDREEAERFAAAFEADFVGFGGRRF